MKNENGKEKEKRKIKLKLIDLKTLNTFNKEFETEFEKDKFERKLNYNKKIKVVHEVNLRC